MNKKQPFYKTGSPLNAHISKSQPKLGHGADGLAPRVVKNPGSNIVGGTLGNQGAMLNGAVSGLRSMFKGIYNLGNTTTTTSSGGNTTRQANRIIRDKNNYAVDADSEDPPQVTNSSSTTPEVKTPVTPVTPTGKKPIKVRGGGSGSSGGGGGNTGKDKNGKTTLNTEKIIKSLPQYDVERFNPKNDVISSLMDGSNSAKGLLTNHRAGDGSTYDGDVSASGKAGRRARRQMKKDDKMAGLTRSERRERKLTAKAMAAQRSAGLGFETYGKQNKELGGTGKAMLGDGEFKVDRNPNEDYGGKARKRGNRLIQKLNNFRGRQDQKTSQGSYLQPGDRIPGSDEINSLQTRSANPGKYGDGGGSTNSSTSSSGGNRVVVPVSNVVKGETGSGYNATISDEQPYGPKKSILKNNGVGSNLDKNGGTAIQSGIKPGKNLDFGFFKKGTPLFNHSPEDPGIVHKQMVDDIDVGGDVSSTYDSKASGFGMNNEAVTSDARFKGKSLSDFAKNSQERKDYYAARGLKQDYTTEIKDSNTVGEEKSVKINANPAAANTDANTGADTKDKNSAEVVSNESNVNENTKNKEQANGNDIPGIDPNQAGVFYKKGPLYKLKQMVRR